MDGSDEHSADGPPASLADSLLALARRRGAAVPEDGSVAGLLAAIDPNPMIPHPLLLVAGAVMAAAFRHDRALAAPPADEPDATPSTDCSF
ncbi:hypothetical protein ABMY26_12120 [Azospirillum sp. HJ39]|uniref:hypothetical protein n=1 Tax=Azospirillum sp. HJ39 TaxID=3159496 RepID=UPI003555E8AC